MKFLKVLLVFAALAAGSLYVFVRLFSRLSGVDMFEALKWTLSTKNWWGVPVFGFFYLVTLACLLILLRKPVTLFDMSATQEGALRGYTIGSQEKLYDPLRRDYRTYENHPHAGAARKFDEAFEVVAFYRDHRWGNYENVDSENPWPVLMVVLFICLMFAIFYLSMYQVAESHIANAGLDQTLSHRMMLANFRQVTGFSFPAVIATVLLIVLVPWFMGGLMAHRIKRGYEERFSSVQKELKRELMASVAPKKILRGRVINRESGSEYILVSDDNGRGSSKLKQANPSATYTIEFQGLIRHTPVYLDFTRPISADDPVIKQLDQLSPPDKDKEAEEKSAWNRTEEAEAAREADFIVNDDYSVSLMKELR